MSSVSITTRNAGIELQNIVEGGEPFEELIDHPAWHDRLLRYCGEKGTYVEGLFIDECFASIRRTGGYFPVHSGGQDGVVRNQYRFVNGQFRCGQVNILLALTDIGPGDGGTMIIPGSHKSNFTHPGYAERLGRDRARWMRWKAPSKSHLNKRRRAAVRRCAVARRFHAHQPRRAAGGHLTATGPPGAIPVTATSTPQELLDRLTPARRKIFQPIPPRLNPGDPPVDQ